MWTYAGLLRKSPPSAKASPPRPSATPLSQILPAKIRPAAASPKPSPSAALPTPSSTAALARDKSRGAHFRTDYPHPSTAFEHSLIYAQSPKIHQNQYLAGRRPVLMKPRRDAVDTIVRMALLEDAPWGDLTSQTLIPATATVTAQLVAREPGVFCGQDIVTAAFLSPTPPSPPTSISLMAKLCPGAIIATIKGPARGILQAERVALNFAQRLSGIATLTAAYVPKTEGTHARIADTRKTTPAFASSTVRCPLRRRP